MNNNEWISVKDTENIPELTREHLIVCYLSQTQYENKTHHSITTAYHVEAMDAKGNMITYWADKESFEPIMYVTHWMKLPNYPK